MSRAGPREMSPPCARRSRAECRQACLRVTKTRFGRWQPIAFPKVGLQPAHPNTSLTFMAASDMGPVCELPTAAAHHCCCSSSGCPGLSLGLCTSLLPHGCSPGPSLPVQKSLLCHKKQKLLCLNPNQLLHVPQNSAQNPNE